MCLETKMEHKLLKVSWCSFVNMQNMVLCSPLHVPVQCRASVVMRSKTTGGSGYEIGSHVTKTTGRCVLPYRELCSDKYRFPRILLFLRSFSVLCTIAAYHCFCHQWLPKRRISKSNSSVRFAWSSTKTRRCCLACTLTARNVYRSM